MRDGHHCPLVQENSQLLPWLLTALAPMSRTSVKELLRSGRVLVNGIPVTQYNSPLAVGDQVTIGRSSLVRPSKITILHDDPALIAIDKPSGLLTVATDTEKLDTAFVRLKNELQSRQSGRPFVVHRIDRDTSGVVLFARSEAIRDHLQATWDRVEKRYLAIVEGSPPTDSGTIENYLLETKSLKMRGFPIPVPGAQHAVSRFQVLSRRHAVSLVEVVIETGRKHQIRVHLAGLGCPVIGDRVYGARTNPAKRLGLHAVRLKLQHPTTSATLDIHAPYPPELARIVAWPVR